MNAQATQTQVAEGQNAAENTAANASAPAATVTENTSAPAAAVKDPRTKQEILRDTLVQAAADEDGVRRAVVTKEGDLFIAKFAGTVVAKCKRCEDLAGLLIEHRYTQTAKWAQIGELKFECEVPEGTPYKAGMSKKGSAGFDKVLKPIVDGIAHLNLEDADALKKIDKKVLVNLLIGTRDQLNAILAK